MLSGQESTGQGIVRKDGNLMLLAKGQVLLLDGAGQQVIHRLGDGRGRIPLLLANPQNLCHLPGGVIRGGRKADFALPHQFRHGFKRLLDSNVVVRLVEVVEVQIIRPEPFETGLDSLSHRAT